MLCECRPICRAQGAMQYAYCPSVGVGGVPPEYANQTECLNCGNYGCSVPCPKPPQCRHCGMEDHTADDCPRGNVDWYGGLIRPQGDGAGGTGGGDAIKPPTIEAMIAARKSDRGLLEFLSEQRGQALTGTDDTGRTLLFFAARGTREKDGKLEQPGGSIAMISGRDENTFDQTQTTTGAAEFLIDRHGLDINHVCDGGLTPLMEAARFANLDMVAMLLARGADPEARDAEGRTALEIAQTAMPQYLSQAEMHVSDDKWEVVELQVAHDRVAVAIFMTQLNALARLNATDPQAKEEALRRSQELVTELASHATNAQAKDEAS